MQLASKLRDIDMVNWVAISKNEHLKSNWKPRDAYNFAESHQIAPVLINELSKITTNFVIGFLDNASLQPVALLGLGGDRNLYVSEDGKWMANYVPASLRSYPFALAEASESENVLCIADSSLTMDREANSLLDEQGGLAPEVMEVFAFLKQCQASEKASKRASRALYDEGLLEAWDLKIKGVGEQTVAEIKGLLRVNEAALIALPDEKFCKLRRNGSITLAYAQLFSMNQLEVLAKRIEYLNSKNTEDSSSQNSVSLNNDQMINFDSI